MMNWILISILATISVLGANSHTIVYPGKSALLSYSPARGEFPVESLFGRGFFSYIDNHGISRTINLEPNPLLGVRVSNDGKLSTDSGAAGSLSVSQKGDRLKPIKEFDERPFQDSLELDTGSAPSLDSDVSKLNEGLQPTKQDEKLPEQILSVTIPKQQEQILLYPQAGTVLGQGSGSQVDGNTYFTSQNIPTLSFPNSPITSRPLEQEVFSVKNPFLNQQLDHPAQNPSRTGNLAVVGQNIPPQLSGQVFFYPPSTDSINAIPTSSDLGAQALPSGQFLLFPQKITNPGELTSAGPLLSPDNQGFSSDSSKLASDTSETLIAPAGQGQTFVNPPMLSSSISNQTPALDSNGIITSQQAPSQVSGQVGQYPGVSSTLSSLPGFDTKLVLEPQVVSGNPFFPPSRFPLTAPPQGVFMAQQGNPFLSVNKNNEKPISSPKPPTTTSAPLFNADQKNPFLTNPVGPGVNLEVPSIQPQPDAVESQPPQLETAKPASISCDYHSVGPSSLSAPPEQIKDTPEVEKAKREHFLAHQLALEQLAQARQNDNNDNNNNQGNDSSLTSASDNSPLYLTANAPLDQPVTSGPTTAFEQTTNTVNSVESETSTVQALPLQLNSLLNKTK